MDFIAQNGPALMLLATPPLMVAVLVVHSWWALRKLGDDDLGDDELDL